MINYNNDFYGWTQEQAALLRAGRLTDLDIENLIEEIETMGRSEKRELESRLTVLLQHLLKWQYQEGRRSKSWTLTIDVQRIQFRKTLKENPGLKPLIGEIIADAYQLAVVYAAKETNISKKVFPSQCPWTFDQITDDTFLPD
jgi:hypothetical protein